MSNLVGAHHLYKVQYKMAPYLSLSILLVISYIFCGTVVGNSTKTAVAEVKPPKTTSIADVKLPKTTVSTLAESATNVCENSTAGICGPTTASLENVTLSESSAHFETTTKVPMNVTLPINTSKQINATVNVTSSDSPNQSNATISVNTTKTESNETNINTTMSVNTTKTDKNPNLKFSLVPEEDCHCDLSKNICDLNCCCDRNCTDEDRSVFSHCIETEKRITSNHCVSKYMMYLNNTQYQVLEDQVGLFCIVVDNMPIKFEYLKHLALKSVNDFKKLWRRYIYYDWELKTPTVTTYKTNEIFKTDSPLLVIRNASLVPLVLPTQMVSSLCQGEVKIKYLKNYNSSCIRRIPKSETECKQLSSILPDHIVSSPPLLNISLLENCSEEVCLPVKKFLCFGRENHEKCEEHNVTFSVFNSSSQSCENLIQSLHFIIYHNGTQGITQIKAFIQILDSAIKYESTFRQYFEVTFEWMRSDNETGFQRSGHPGYLVGKPVISGIQIDNETGNKTLEMIDSRKDWISLSTSNNDGNCDGNQRANIVFGYNFHTECVLQVVGSCQQKQAIIWQQLMGRKINKSENIFISSYGDPDVNSIEDWVPLLQEVVFEPLQLVTQINIKIISTSIGAAFRPQAKIIGAYLEPIYIDCENTNSSQVLSLTSSVIFVDITKPPLSIFAQPPVFEIKLPKDFFYPFLSRSTLNIPSIYLVVIQLVIIFIYQR